MEALFKKYFWVIKTIGIATACGLAASAVTTQVGSMFLFTSGEEVQGEGETDGETDGEDGDDEGDDGKPKRKGFSFDESAFGVTDDNQRVRAKRQVGDDIRKRNIFCPTCVPEGAEEATPGPLDAAAGGAAGGSDSLIQPGETKSKLPLRLMATMEAEDPELSFATILDEEAGVAGLYGRGDEVRAGVVVTKVDQALVHLRNKAALEYLELGDAAPVPTTSTTTKPPTSTAPPKNDRSIPGAEEAINCPSENTCVVERAFVEQLLANPAMLAKQARIVPKQKDDEVLGYKLYGIRRGSLPKLLGLKNGDMVTAVNGEDLKGMDKAMALFTKLRRASNLSVSIERKGKQITKEIQIQ